MKNILFSGGLPNRILSSLFLVFSICVIAPGASAAIGINFAGANTTAMAGSETAGVIPEPNWNNASGPNSASPLGLVDGSGAATNAFVSWTSDNVWNTAAPDATGNNRMMRGYLDNGNGNPSTVAVSGLPGGTYNIYIYVDGDNGTSSRTGIYQISGPGMTTVSISLTDAPNANFSGTFIQGTNSSGNYILFSGVTIGSAFTLTATPGATTDSYTRAPVNAIQIIPLSVPNPDFTIVATPISRTVIAGNLTTYSIAAGAVNGFSGTVSLSASGLPAGATASFSPAAITGSGNSTLTVTTIGSTPVGAAALTFSGISGSLTHSVAATLAVTAAPSPAAISVRFVGTAPTPMASTETAGVVAKNNWNNASGALSTSELSLIGETGSATGASVTWTSDNAWSLPIADVAGNNRMMSGYLDNANGNPSTVNVSGMIPGKYNIYVYAAGDIGGVPRTGIYQLSGPGIATTSIAATDAPNTTFGGTFVAANNSTGNYVLFSGVTIGSAFTLTATPGATTDFPRAPVNAVQIIPVSLPSPDFTLAATPIVQTVTAGNLTTYSIAAGTVNGFSGTISLSASGLPAGATASFSPAAITGSGNSTLTVTTIGSTPVGAAPLTFSGISGSLTHSVAATLAVTAAPSPAAISVRFVGTAPTPMASTETAGVVAKNNWNNASGALSNSALSLISETGSATGASVSWTSDNAWSLPIADVAGNNRMMSGYLDNGNGNPSTVNVSGMIPGKYNIYVYAAGAVGSASRTGNYQIGGPGIPATSIAATDAANTNFSGTFVAANNSNGNYVLFSGVTIGSAFTLTATPGATADVPRAPVNAIQMIPAVADFSVSVTPGSQTVIAGGATTFTVTTAALNGFNGSLNMSASGLPAGVSISFNPAASGPASVIATVATLAATPAGTSTLTINVTSGSLTHTAMVLLTVIANQPPTVSAGPPQTITLPATAQLSGTATDGGLPNGILTYSWSLASGPGTVTFGNAQSLSTTAAFSTAGTYALALTASNGALTGSAQCTITVLSVSISLTPASTTLLPWQTQQFTATVAGSSNTAVAWTLNPAVGTISTAGMYTAPAGISTSQTVTVAATSMADPSKSASAVLVVLPAVPAYYISGAGNDSWSGQLPSPNAANTNGPFLTLARAQQAMQASSTVKTTFIRAGTYYPKAVSGLGCFWGGQAAINLVAADSGETWSYYAGDGVGTAILDGGAPAVTQSGTAPNANGKLACAFAADAPAPSSITNVTITGLQFQNWNYSALAVNSNGNTGTATFMFTNNTVHDSRLPSAGGVTLSCTSSTVSNNYFYNISGAAILSGASGTNCAVSNQTVSNNFLLNTCVWNGAEPGGGDCGAIYAQLPNQSNSNINFTNNYIRDVNAVTAGAGAFGNCCAQGIYLDGPTYNVNVTGNVITGTKSACFQIHGGGQHITGNLCDLGTAANGPQFVLTDYYQDGNVVTGGNLFENNIVVGSSSGTIPSQPWGVYQDQRSGSGTSSPATITNNAYYNYAGTAINSTGSAASDTNPVYENAQLSCWAVGIAAGSPVFNPPVSFPRIRGGWGPPGFVVPQTGTAPSWPHGC